MIGYNIGWAAFAILEVMSQSRFGHKRIGYLAANQVVKQMMILMMMIMMMMMMMMMMIDRLID